MITPGLIRRSLGRGLQWRFLLLWMVALFVPTLIALRPIAGFLGHQLDQWPRAKEVVATMDGATFVEVLRQLGENGANTAIQAGFAGAALTLLFLTPALAGAALALARSDETLRFTALLRGAGEGYGKMLRLGALVALIPLGIAAIPTAVAFKLANQAGEKALLESQAALGARAALLVAAISYFLAQLILDAARAHFAAQPERRSAFLCWWNGVKLLFRQPGKMLAIGAATSLFGLGLAALLLVLRLRIFQGGPGGIVLAFMLAQLAVASVGWVRASRMIALTELVRADALDRTQRESRRRSRFEMQPPVTSPPAPGRARSEPVELREPGALPAGPSLPLVPDTGLPLSEHVEAFPERIEEQAQLGSAPAGPAARLPGQKAQLGAAAPGQAEEAQPADKPPSLSGPDGSGT